jgi:MATE family multidrug resistance protein
MEVAFFTIVCLGAPFSLPNQSLAGFFTGRGETRLVMFVQIIGILTNAILDYLLIFGPGPFPRMGIVGAGIATVTAQAVVTLLLLWCFLSAENRSGFGTWAKRAFDRGITWQLIRFGVPNGSRFTVEMIAWTVFIFFVGRLGTLQLTATNIAWRINGIAFFPIIGLSQAVGILVGNAQGEGRSDISVDVTRKGLLLGEAWMVSAALFFVLFPHQLYGLFHDPAVSSPQYFAELAGLGAILLRFVALYSLLDGFNIIILGTLQSAGDTAWTLLTSAVLHVIFIAALVAADVLAPGVMLEWAIATAFVMLQAAVWVGRFLSGKWRGIKVVESGVVAD